MPTAETGTYSTAVVPTGGAAPYTFSPTGGVLPPGIHVDPATGRVSGTSTTSGTYRFTVTVTVTVTDTAGQRASRHLTVVVGAQDDLSYPIATTPSGHAAATGGTRPPARRHDRRRTGDSFVEGLEQAAPPGSEVGDGVESGADQQPAVSRGGRLPLP